MKSSAADVQGARSSGEEADMPVFRGSFMLSSKISQFACLLFAGYLLTAPEVLAQSPYWQSVPGVAQSKSQPAATATTSTSKTTADRPASGVVREQALRPVAQQQGRTGLFPAQPGVIGLKPGKTGNPAWDRLSADQKQVYTGGWGMQNPSGGLSTVVDWGQNDRFGAGGQVSRGVPQYQPNWSNQSQPVMARSLNSSNAYFSNGVPQRSASMQPVDTSWSSANQGGQVRMQSVESIDGAWSSQTGR
ncbi:hypothetical protein A6X21_18140 [Planctopirus hydrillae]|uniref:Uncharacterized protein n=2 Tax=Planctopirus hydrillae TaxID=1841610 RepID=A0A1C3EKS8_9PLAN|nr:hypothetical protein A6X21_18140 [Planctopirus hydrillae]